MEGTSVAAGYNSYFRGGFEDALAGETAHLLTYSGKVAELGHKNLDCGLRGFFPPEGEHPRRQLWL